MKWKRILMVYGIALVAVSLSLIIAPAFAQSIGQKVIFPALKTENIINVETVDPTWQRSKENTISFVLDANTIKKSYEIKMKYEFNIKEYFNRSEARRTVALITYLSNGEYVHQRRETWLIDLGSGGGYVDSVTIPHETLKIGENTVKILININSTTSEPITKPGLFYIVYDEINVVERRIDTDSDGISNSFDPVVNTNNLQLSAMLMIALFPPITATGIERKKKE